MKLIGTIFLLPVLFLKLSLNCCAAGANPESAADWNVAVLDSILASVSPGQNSAQIDDMLLPVSYLRGWRDKLAGAPQSRTAFSGTFTAWPGGNVYYAFDPSVSAWEQAVFLSAAAEWATFANLHFIARTSEPNYIQVVYNPSLSGGNSYVGMVGGPQLLQIGPGAWNHATVCHELGHALGLVHEHQRSDRDSFVTINTNNILPGNLADFVKLSDSRNQTPYDFLSVMHYSRNAFSVNPASNTIVPLAGYMQYLNIMGQQFDPVLSGSDRAGVAQIYGLGPGATNLVTTTLDNGPGSLRAALYYAFDHPGTAISFNIPLSDPGYSNGVFNILPTDNLPSLVNATIVDGGTEPLAVNPDGPQILLAGTQAQPPSVYASGFRIRGTNNVIRSFVINNFPQFGIWISGGNASNNTVSDCYLGIDPTGTLAVTNGIVPLEVDAGASSNLIGGLTPADRNVISGSHYQGLVIRDSGTRFNAVEGNFIGLNALGTAALPNNWAGIQIFGGSQSNQIGGYTPAARNVISGNTFQGVAISDPETGGNVLAGNFIGVNPAGTAAIANGWSGVEIFGGSFGNTIGGTRPGAGNLISGNLNYGFLTSSTNQVGTTIQGNIFGANTDGTTAIGNGYAGVAIDGGSCSNIVGGFSTAARNLVSGNLDQGIILQDAGTVENLVVGNYVGVDSTGMATLGNGWSGVELYNGAASNTVANNVISGNGQLGVLIHSGGAAANWVSGNDIGVDVSGTTALGNGWAGVAINSGAQSNIIGGSVVAARNIISGNGNQGLAMGDAGTSGNVVEGNYIGVDVSGEHPIRNDWAGVNLYGGAAGNLVGGTLPGMGNIVSGNGDQGILLGDVGTDANTVQGNWIGLDAAGLVAISNGWSGVELYNGPSGNLVGGYGSARNFISGNGNYGITINNGSSGNVIQGNSIGLDGNNGPIVPNQWGDVILFAGAQSNLIGGLSFGAANLISGSTTAGIALFDAATAYNTIRGNSIFGNQGIGIALNNLANHNLSAPVITSAMVTTDTAVAGTYAGGAGQQYQLDFYADAPETFGAEAMTYLGSITVTGTGSVATFNATLGACLPAGRVVTATATDPSGNTSQLSTGVTVSLVSTPNDGIPDAWRAQYFGGNGTTTNSRSAVFADPDGDGMNNYQEFLAGTNPTNQASALDLVALNPLAGTNAVRLNSVAGRVYRVLTRDDLGVGAWSILADQVIGTGTNILLADPATAVLPRRFYRAQVLW
jgi:hypothetical protein